MKKLKHSRPSKASPGKRATGALRFDKGRGETVDFVEFHTDSGFHVLEIRFRDQTALHFTIEPLEPAFNVEPGYSTWKQGNERVLKRWPPIHCS